MTESRSKLREKWQPFFDLIWKAYPLHQDYGGAFISFLDLLESNSIDPDHILEKAESYGRNVDPAKMEYVPHLKSWLRGRRFEDEDLFTDRAVALREWFASAWRRGDVQSVVNRYGFIYNRAPIPPNVEDIKAWHLDQAKLWIVKVARHVIHGEEPPE